MLQSQVFILVPYRIYLCASMDWPLIDLLELHHPKDTEKSSVRGVGGRLLNEIFNELCEDYIERNRISYKVLANEILEVNAASVQNWRGFNQNYNDGHPIPLWALKKLLELNELQYTDKHKEIINSISYLQCGRVSEKLRAQKFLTPELAKLCGAHAADGCLNGAKNKGPLSARWDLGDQEKENVLEARNWLENCFGFKPILMQKGKMAYTWSNKQIISRYLTRIFDFPIGSKCDIVKMPAIFKTNDKRVFGSADKQALQILQLEFSKEVINFDGHSTLSGNVVQAGFGSNSRPLLEDVKEVFQRHDVNFHIYKNKILTTSYSETKKLYSLGLFRGLKKGKFDKLILQHSRKAEKYP